MSDTDRTSRLPSSMPPPSAAPQALPEPDHPQRRWAVEMTKQITELRDDVRDLTEVATRCFEELQRQNQRVKTLETEVEQLKAKMTLRPPAPDPEQEVATSPDNPRPSAPPAPHHNG